MAGTKSKKGKTVKKKAVVKKVSKGTSKKEKKKVTPKKTKKAPPKKTVKKAPQKAVKPVAVKKKKAVVKEEDFRSAFMKSLEAKREELQEALARLMHSRKEYEGELTAGDFIDEIDDAQREISAYSQFSLIERKNKELQKINYLLSRIESEEDFGICEECGTPIPRERLLIVPETTLCVACQRELEKMDQRKSMAAKSSSAMGPTRRGVSWESNEPADEDDNVLVEYQIGSAPSMDIDETETPSDDREEK
jgi:RNA polymerase-binding protein DksA